MKRVVWMTCLLLGGVSIGCGGGGDAGTAQSDAGDTNPAAAAPKISHVLVGEWYGGLDLNPEQAKQIGYTEADLQQMANMRMSIEFSDTGEMAMQALIPQMWEGAPAQETASIAKWKVVNEEGNRYTIQSIEEGTEATDNLVVELADRDTIVVDAGEGMGYFRLKRR